MQGLATYLFLSVSIRVIGGVIDTLKGGIRLIAFAMRRWLDRGCQEICNFRKKTVPKHQKLVSKRPNHCTKRPKTRFQSIFFDPFVSINMLFLLSETRGDPDF